VAQKKMVENSQFITAIISNLRAAKANAGVYCHWSSVGIPKPISTDGIGSLF
jgi:hypothetical protein